MVTAGQPPREALAAVERCLEAAGCPDAACDARELFRLATGRDPRLSDRPLSPEEAGRLEEAARAARDGGFDYFTTTLSISPLKNAKALNEIGEELGRQYGVAHLPADFKKKEGYKRSILLSREYGLYRQDYCGCVYSRLERERQKQQGKKGEED